MTALDLTVSVINISWNTFIRKALLESKSEKRFGPYILCWYTYIVGHDAKIPTPEEYEIMLTPETV